MDFLRRFLRNNIRLAVLLTIFLIVLGGTWVYIGPSHSMYKFMHCEKCKSEWPIDYSRLKENCPKCQRDRRIGKIVATTRPLKENPVSPWARFALVSGIETVVFMGVLVFAIKPSNRIADQKVLYCNCPHCKWRLRFKESSAGKGGVCPRCKRIFRFPDEEAADKMPIREPLTEEIES